MRREFKYILRFKIDPSFHAEDRMQELLEFCRSARIGEVMLFLAAEELSAGHITREELAAYIPMTRKLKALLQRLQIGLSFNPWTTTYHTARGRTLKPGQSFTRMVGETGAQDALAACPLCPEWQAYLNQTFADLAREVQPVAIWVEDDFRLHNHSPELGWGGCFCELHLERFSRLVGARVGREEILAKLTASGQPHPWRKLWLDLARDTLLEPAQCLRRAVEQAQPGVRLGLMTSSPDAHSIEGRDWHALQHALGSGPSFLVRPHLPPYTEERALHTVPSVTRHTLANLCGPLEVYPELENSPRCGRYSKSGTFSVWECYEAAVLGGAGITINHFDMMGNGITLDPGFSDYLAQAKPRLDALAELELDDRQAQGVQVLFHPEIAAHCHARGNMTLNGLRCDSTVWAKTLAILGIAHGFTREITPPNANGRAADGDRSPIAVNGQTLRALTEPQITALLAGPTILDAESAEILLDRGHGEQIGISTIEWKTLEQAVFAYETILEDDPTLFGLSRPRMTAQRCAQRLLAMEPLPAAEVLSSIHAPDHRQLFPGAVLFRNRAGGSIVTLAYPFDGQEQFYMGFFNRFRRIMLQRIVFRLAPQAPLAMGLEFPLFVFRSKTRRGPLLAVLNPTLDTLDSVLLRVPHGQFNHRDLQLLDDNGQWQSVAVEEGADNLSDTIRVEHRLPPLAGQFLIAAARDS